MQTLNSFYGNKLNTQVLYMYIRLSIAAMETHFQNYNINKIIFSKCHVFDYLLMVNIQ